MSMLYVYLLVCTILLIFGLAAEKYILKNKIKKELVFLHVLMWYTPFVNFVCIFIVSFHILFEDR